MDTTARRQDDAGMSMIEIIIALMLLALLVLAMAPVFVGALELSRTNATISRATQVVNAQLELARDQAALNPNCAAIQMLAITTTTSVADADAEPLTYTRAVGPCPASYPGTVEVSATVSRTGTGDVIAEASTLVAVTDPS